MARKSKKISYSKGCLAFFVLCIISFICLSFPYLSGGEMSAVPMSILGEKLNIFAVVIILLKLIPLCFIAFFTIMPTEIIKKYVIIAFFALWLSIGEIVSTIIMLQFYEGVPSIGFIISVIVAISMFALTLVFTKMSKLPAKHKELVWYKSLNNIITMLSTPIALAFTISMVLFSDIVFCFELPTMIGIILLWICFVVCAVTSLFTLFEWYKTGMLYYIVAFLNALSFVLLSWSANIASLLLGAALAALAGAFWLFMGSVVKKHF